MSIVEELSGIKGHVSAKELVTLYRCAKQLKTGNIIEIGSYQGLSTIAMAKGLQDGNCSGRVYAIDPHDSYTDVSDTNPNFKTTYGPEDMAAFLRNVVEYQVEDRIFPIAANSRQVFLDVPCEMVFIDGDHSYGSVFDDFIEYAKDNARDSLVLFHDSKWEGPEKAIEYAKEFDFVEVTRADSLTVLRKLK